MTRTVYTSDMVCHLWSNRHHVDVRTSTGNLYTRGGVLFSYGSHYAIAAFLNEPKSGGGFIVWNDRHYSNTTARHSSRAWQALAGWQRSDVVRVPDLNADTVRNPEKLAAACIHAAKDPLKACDKARSALGGHLHMAQMWFDSARRLFTYAGNEKAAAAVPTIDGTDKDQKALKAHAADVLRSIARADMLETAKNYAARAIGDLNAAETRVTLYSERDQTSRKYPHGVRYSYDTATGICQAANDAILNSDKAVQAFKQAAANVPPMVYRTKKKAEQIKADYTHAARAEQLNERRQTVAQNKRAAVRLIADYKRGEGAKLLKTGTRIPVRSAHSLQWRFERVQNEMPHANEYAELFEQNAEKERSEWSAILGRVSRIIAADSLKRAIDDTVATCDAYETEQNGRFYTVPDSRFVSGQLSKWAAFNGGTVPEFWEEKAAAIVNRAQTLARGHDERLQRLHAEKIAAWRNGENVSAPRDIPPMVRIVGQTVQTSYGATVPLDHAARLVKIAKRIAASGGADYANGDGPMVGHFRVNAIRVDLSAIIGCHNFTAEESNRAIALIEAATT